MCKSSAVSSGVCYCMTYHHGFSGCCNDFVWHLLLEKQRGKEEIGVEDEEEATI